MNAKSLAILGAGVGVVVWTATEYASHRWILHGPFGKGQNGPLSHVPLGELHRDHHREPLATVLAARLAGHGAIAGVGAAGAVALAAVAPRPFALAAGAAWTAGYSSYEVSHWLAHHRAPRTRQGVRLRRRHFRHHFGAPRSNLGITMSWWDRVLGTEAEGAPARVPVRHAPLWLLDENGAVSADLQADFVLLDG